MCCFGFGVFEDGVVCCFGVEFVWGEYLCDEYVVLCECGEVGSYVVGVEK